jgi:hypothetical protein
MSDSESQDAPAECAVSGSRCGTPARRAALASHLRELFQVPCARQLARGRLPSS